MVYPDELAKALKAFPSKNIQAGETLLYQGEVPRAAIVVTDGFVKAFSISTAGEEHIVTFHEAGDILPTAWAFDRASSSLYYYQTLVDCKVIMVPKIELTKIVFSTPAVTKALAEKYIQDFSASLIRITALEQARAREKIIFTLFYLMQRYGKEIVPGHFSIRLELTHNTIANLVGLTRETTAMELSNLKKAKVLSYRRQKYLIKRELLLKMLGEDSFESLII